MTKSEFIELVQNHNDIMMHCGDFNFTVMTCYDDLMINDESYKTIDDMLIGFKINGKTLEESLNSITLDCCS